MEIKSVDINFFFCDKGVAQNSKEAHHKTLPYLSIAQSVTGSYEFSLDDGKAVVTGKKGAFIAPSDKMQHIKHCTDTGEMQIQWLFLDVTINKKYKIDDVFEFPLLMPIEYNEKIYRLLCRLIKERENICECYIICYEVVSLLMSIGKEKNTRNSVKTELVDFVEKHYRERLTAEDIATSLNLSVPTVYRRFSECFNLSPANYINNVRLIQAAALLEITDKNVSEIGDKVGFSDAFYFSKLFKRKFGVSPATYRKKRWQSR